MASATPALAPRVNPVTEAANRLATATDSDVFLYNSDIYRPNDDEVISGCAERNRRPKVVVVLVSEGGDPDAAYRIARCFQTHYEKFTCLIVGYCKSAGALIATGAHELVMSNSGELGPLDIQMTKKDELWEYQSGLTVMSALDALHEKAFSAFESFFLEIKRRSRNTVTFKTAAEISVKLATGLFCPIFQQIDPMHVGEASRAQAIAQHYGLRLALNGKNISDSSLNDLVSSYPAHGFVIDREEASSLFKLVREPNKEEKNLIGTLGQRAVVPLPKGNGTREFLSDEKEGANVTGNTPADAAPGPGSGEVTPATIESTEQKNVARRSAAAS
jgi:Serine dehydrogenase proteinase